MDAREYLTRVRTIDYKIKTLESEIGELEDLSRRAGAMDYTKEFIQGGESTNEPAFLKTLDRLMETEKRYSELMDEYQEYREAANLKIHKLSNGVDIMVLYKKFMLFQRLEDIAEEMSYSFETIRWHYRRGLREFDERRLWEDD